MKNIGGLVIAALAAGSVAQTLYTVKLSRQVGALSARLTAPESGGDEGTASVSAGAGVTAARRATIAPRGVPVFVPTAAPAPLPAVIESESSREMLRGFVVAELARIKHDKDEGKRIKKEEKDQKKESQRDKKDGEFRDRIAKEMGLPEPEGKRLGEILAAAEKTRKTLRESEKAGQATPEATAAGMASLKAKTQSDLKTALGDGWAQKLEDADKRIADSRKKDQASKGAAKGPFWFVSSTPPRP